MATLKDIAESYEVQGSIDRCFFCDRFEKELIWNYSPRCSKVEGYQGRRVKVKACRSCYTGLYSKQEKATHELTLEEKISLMNGVRFRVSKILTLPGWEPIYDEDPQSHEPIIYAWRYPPFDATMTADLMTRILRFMPMLGMYRKDPMTLIEKIKEIVGGNVHVQHSVFHQLVQWHLPLTVQMDDPVQKVHPTNKEQPKDTVDAPVRSDSTNW